MEQIRQNKGIHNYLRDARRRIPSALRRRDRRLIFQQIEAAVIEAAGKNTLTNKELCAQLGAPRETVDRIVRMMPQEKLTQSMRAARRFRLAVAACVVVVLLGIAVVFVSQLLDVLSSNRGYFKEELISVSTPDWTKQTKGVAQ